jgi:phosphatidate cytidylyltransferase
VVEVVTRLVVLIALLFGFGAILMVAIHRRRPSLSGNVRADWIKYTVFAGIITGVIAVAELGRVWTALLFVALSLYGSLELVRHLHLSFLRQMLITVLCATLVAFLLAHLLMLPSSDWLPRFVFGFVVVAVTDSYSQLWGRLLGRHRLCPNLSPNKTWEGLGGGFVAAVISAWRLGFLIPHTSVFNLLAAGGMIALVATVGDLMFSAAKRLLQIKDFSNLLPGHGGLLDRFDSLVVAAPCIYWIDRLILR